jgi:hypothetical protein
MKQKKELADAVKRKLWKFGYSVKDFSDNEHVGFDLLVQDAKEKTLRVFVGETWPKQIPEGCDVFAVVKDEEITFVTNTMEGHTSPYAVFGKK